MKKTLSFLVLLLAALCSMAATPFSISHDGVPRAGIAIDQDSTGVLRNAAPELRHWLAQVTGAELPIVPLTDANPKIILTCSPERLELWPEDSAALQGNDGFAVRSAKGDLYLLGATPKGVLNGVFRMLAANTGIIWLRPSPDGTFFQRQPTLVFSHTDYRDIPKFHHRGWLFASTTEDTLVTDAEWCVRNCANNTNFSSGKWPFNRKWGMESNGGGGHNLNKYYIRESEYYESHPEYFPLIQGKRIRPSSRRQLTQICFTNKEMLQAFLKRLDQLVENQPNHYGYTVSIEDNFDQCECPDCRADISLPDGRILKDGAPAFYSTRFFIFLNRVARHLKERHPGKYISTLAYFFTEIPPEVPLEDNICVKFASIQRNSKYPFNHQENAQYRERLDRWTEICRNVDIRDYYGLQVEFPRPIARVALEDFRYAYSRGVRMSYSEIVFDSPPRRNTSIFSRDGQLIWDLSAPCFYAINQGLWNPELDAVTLREECIRAIYGKGAEEMTEFYRIIDKQWDSISGKSLWNDDSNALWKRYIISHDLHGKLLKLVEEAHDKTEDARCRAAQERIIAHIRKVSKSAEFRMDAQYIAQNPPFDPDFLDGEWSKTSADSSFYQLRSKASATNRIEVKALFDRDNLYIGAKCLTPAKKEKDFIAPPVGIPRDQWHPADKFEIFLSDAKNHICQFIVDVHGNVLDSKDGSLSWNGDFQSKVVMRDGSWSILLTIPFRTLDYTEAPEVCLDLMMLHYTCLSSTPPVSECAVWNQGFPNVRETYGKLFLKY